MQQMPTNDGSIDPTNTIYLYSLSISVDSLPPLFFNKYFISESKYFWLSR